MHIRGIRGNANVCTLFVGLTLMIQYVFYYIAVCVCHVDCVYYTSTSTLYIHACLYL